MRTKPVSPRSTSRAAQGVHWLGVLAWAVPCVAAPLAAAAVGTTGVAPVGMLVPAMGALFSVLVARLVLAARADPGRRLSIACLVAGLLLWATSSVQVSLAPDGAMLQFPAPGEWFGLASGAAFAAHLFVDAAQRVRATLGDWLEAVVAAGGAVCLVAGVVVTPLSDVFARQGVPLLVALTYPAIDLLLLAVVVAQVVLRRRAVSAQTGILVAALVVLSGADLAGSVVNLVDGGYTYTLVGDVGWSLAFILLVDSACRERAEPRPGEHAPGRGLVTVAAAAAALVVLTVQPPGPARPYVVVPADVTFVAA
ncbi:MAG TPA: hypothetical protein VE781_02295, partial [Kineosporiaceae bacterium]|nr:hypothetical protein [Kineosporiaceae bacterium]